MGMCNLIITRKKQIVASLASCNIIIDDIDYGAIKNGSVLQCSLNDGNHEITLKWWRKRKNSVFSVYIPSDRDTVHINVNFSKSKEEFTLVSNDVKIENCSCNVSGDNYIVEQNPLHMQISPEEKLQRLIVEAPHISLNEGEVCYKQIGDQFYPQLELPEQTDYEIGKYGNLHLAFLKNHKRGTYTTLLTEGRLNEHLHTVDEQAAAQMESIVAGLVKKNGITEELKATDQIRWVQEMNNARACAEEFVLREVIYR